MDIDATDGTHGFGYGVTGALLRALLAARGLCPDCAGTGRRWCVHTRSSVGCSVCSGGTLATGAAVVRVAVAALPAGGPPACAAAEELAAD